MDWLFGGFSNSCCSIQQCKSPELVLQNGVSDAVSPLPANSHRTISPSTLRPVEAPEFPEFGASGSGRSSCADMEYAQTGMGLALKKGTSDRTHDGATTPSTRDCSARSISSHLIGDMLSARYLDEPQVRSQLKSFVRGMVQGREVSALSIDGELRTCTWSFDRKLRNLSVLTGCDTRLVPLSRIKEILEGTEPQDIATPLDDLCSTLVLDSGECLSYRFKTVEEREHVCFCLQMIVDKHGDNRQSP